MRVAVSTNSSDAMKEFWLFAKDFKSASAWVAKAAIAAPLADILLNLGPPWPSRVGVAILVCIVEVIVLMWSFEFWKHGETTIAEVRKVMRWSLIGAAFIVVPYLWLFASYVEDAPNWWTRVVIGTTYHEEIGEMVHEDPSKYTTRELLERFERQPERIWTKDSIIKIQVILLACWLLFWIALSCYVAAFVTLRWRRIRIDRGSANVTQ